MNGKADSIFEAIRQGDLDAVKSGIGRDAALVNATGEDDLTPLHVAVIEDKIEIALWLIGHGANTEAVDSRHGASPMGWAAYLAKADMMRVLLDNGVSPKRANAYGKTPYQVAELGAAGEWKDYTDVKPEAYKEVMQLLHAHGAADTRKEP